MQFYSSIEDHTYFYYYNWFTLLDYTINENNDETSNKIFSTVSSSYASDPKINKLYKFIIILFTLM